MAITDTLTAFDTLVRWSLTAVVWGSVVVLAVLALRWALNWWARKIEDSQDRAWERQREKWAEVNCGNMGGMPTAVELHQATARPTAVEQHRQSRPSTYAKASADKKAPDTGSGLPVGRDVPGYGGEWD